MAEIDIFEFLLIFWDTV